MTNHAMAATIKAAKAAPTRPPTIPPVFELLCEVEVGVDDELAEVALGDIGPWNCAMVVIFAWLPWIPYPSLGEIESSGKSPRASASVRFQLSATDESKYAHLGIGAPAGIGSGKVPGLALAVEVQLNDHLE